MLQKIRHALGVWPLPAVLAWAGAWGVFRWAAGQGVEVAVALGAATALGVLCSLWGDTWWRRVLIAGGFPLSCFLVLSEGAMELPAWAWLLALLLLMLVYPINAWRDAPLFPTPRRALQDLPQQVPLPANALILDAGCGLGHGLQALHSAYPDARLHGLEWSWPLRFACALRCPWARVRQGDIWKADWSAYDMVYLFQRPESMERAMAKAREQLNAGAWLVSLDFEIIGHQATTRSQVAGGKMVWVYRIPPKAFFGE